MMQCKAPHCVVSSPRKIKSNGYCDRHQNAAPTPTKPSSGADITVILSRLTKLEEENKIIKEENASMKTALKAALSAIDGIHKNINDERSSINTSNYERDALEQYNRLESYRVLDVEELPLKCDADGKVIDDEDCDQLAIDAAAVLDVKITKNDIQRAHRIGRKKKPFLGENGKLVTPKPRQVIVKLKDYSKRLNIIKKKRNFGTTAKAKGFDNMKDAFIVEDLTPLRSKLLWYAKNQCNGKFKNCHTKNGKILAQTEQSKPNEWISLSTPEDFHAHNVNIDLKMINDGLRKIQILKDLEFVSLSDLLE